MKTVFTRLTLFAISAGLIASCHTGPSGPDPGQEIVVNYTTGSLEIPDALEKSCDMILSGDSVRMTFVYYLHDTLKGSEAQFNDVTVTTFSTPKVVVRFRGALPTSPGTFPWEPTKFNNNPPPTNPDITTGVVIRYDGITYYPVEGTTVVTNVRKHPNGNLAGIDGYFNGKLRAVWPSKFIPSVSNPLPPGYDDANPSLVGEHLTVQSCVFSNRSNSDVPVTGGN